ncbi:hypothetical protein [Kitasatospora sp. NPDC093558]|uniref:hypothetical protein n=1 Tax=Kitasatospora sp. NPDC093558 TaxID=3155201 RepID=UPI003435F29B
MKLADTAPEPTAETCDAELRHGAGHFGVLLAVGDRYCYRTRAGRIAYLKLKTVQPVPGPLRFTVTVWDTTPR